MAGRASVWSLRKIRAKGRGTGKTRGRKRAVDGRGNCHPHLSCQLPGAYGIRARWSPESRLLDDSRAVTLQSLAAWMGSPGRWL